ncbi:MAG: antitoxin VbhA family protein [Terracidiphilus sp.]
MLQPEEKEKLERGFAEGEASLLLEGLKPTSFGLSLKDRVLAGMISIEQAEAELCAHYTAAMPAAS